MRAEDHLESFKEHKEAIFEWALKINGLKNSQRVVGLHASRGIVDLLSAYLHEKNKTTVGMQINHRWFKSMKVMDKLPAFDKKEKVVDKINKLELLCEDLSYGAPKPVEKIKGALKLFNELEEEIEKLRKNGQA